MDVYPCLTYHDVRAALSWLTDAFGVKPLVLDSEANETIENAAVAHRDGMVLIAAERPEDLHGRHTGQGWLYLAVDDIDRHYARTKTAGPSRKGNVEHSCGCHESRAVSPARTMGRRVPLWANELPKQ